MTIGGGASPWGLGAWLMICPHIVEFYRDAITPFDVALFGHPVGDSEGQQTWEALNFLVALRLWKARWQQVRVNLHVRADNIHALRLVST